MPTTKRVLKEQSSEERRARGLKELRVEWDRRLSVLDLRIDRNGRSVRIARLGILKQGLNIAHELTGADLGIEEPYPGIQSHIYMEKLRP